MAATPHFTVSLGPVDETGQLLHEGDLTAQLALAVTNLETVLAGHGLGWPHVTDLIVRTTDPDGLALVLDTLDERFTPAGAAPAVSVIPVTELDLPGMTVALAGVVSPRAGRV